MFYHALAIKTSLLSDIPTLIVALYNHSLIRTLAKANQAALGSNTPP